MRVQREGGRGPFPVVIAAVLMATVRVEAVIVFSRGVDN